MNVKTLQAAISATEADGWLLCDFHNRDPIAARVLGLDARAYNTRRWFYYIPRVGQPQKIVHSIEAKALDACPGIRYLYRGHEELHNALRSVLKGVRRVAMNYSPRNNIPTVSTVDAGTVELIRSFGVEVISSANLVAAMHSTIDARGLAAHQKAGKIIQTVKDEAFGLIFHAIKKGKKLSEFDVQQYIMERFAEEGVTSGSHGPIVAANAHAADPHFEPPAKGSSVFKKGDRILLDIWGKLNQPDGIYYDITWCGFAGEKPPADYVKLFALAVRARDTALQFARDAFAEGRTVRGNEVDQVCRGVIASGGYEKFFTHRTGHSIGTEVHGEGANIDSIETLDDRALLPATCFSIEPGIYASPIGVRTEISVCITPKKQVEVYGAIQTELLTM